MENKKNQTTNNAGPTREGEEMPFGKMNYIVFLVGLFTVILGFYLMAGEKFIDATQFSYALYVAPPVIILGFVIIAYAIMINPDKKSLFGKKNDGSGTSGQA